LVEYGSKQAKVQNKLARRRAAILAAAAGLFAERKDVEAVSVDDIAAAAGVAKATLYRHFPSKAAIVAAVAAEHGADVAAWQPADRRAQILDAALRLIPQRGLQATTMEQIAEAAGISPATIYWHFASKDELVIAMVDRSSPLDDVRRVLARGAAGDPADDLRALLRLMLQVFAERVDVMLTCMMERWASPQVAAHVLYRVILPLWSTVGAYLEAQITAGRLRPAASQANVVGQGGPAGSQADPRGGTASGGVQPQTGGGLGALAPALPRVFSLAGPIFAFTLARRAFGTEFPIDAGQMIDTLVDTFLAGAATDAYRAELAARRREDRP
jgi:AcrR family transcriptional regulator